MANVKNYGLAGIGSDVQFGKSGGRLIYDTSSSFFKFTTDGTKILKKSKNETNPRCQTISVVISPNGEKAPPALAATTMLIRPGTTKALLPRPATITTVPSIRAVVKLSAIGERKKAIIPEIINIFL